MSDLRPEDRTLLDLARDAHEPSESDRGRVRRALLLRLGTGTALAGTAATTSKAATTTALTKVIVGVAIAAAIGGTGAASYLAAKPQPPQAATSRGAPLSEPRAAAQSPTQSPTLTPTPTPALPLTPSPTPTLAPTPALAPDLPPAQATRASADNHRVRITSNAPPPATVSDSPGSAPTDTEAAPSATNATLVSLQPTTLEAETRLIRAGVAALHRGDAEGALAIFEEHRRAFPNGALAEERAAERVIALGDLHRCQQARAAAAEFILEHPHSPLGTRVREACALAPNP